MFRLRHYGDSFLNISKTTRASIFKIYNNFTLGSLNFDWKWHRHLPPIGSKLHKCDIWGPCSGRQFWIMVRTISKRFAVLERGIQMYHFLLRNPLLTFLFLAPPSENGAEVDLPSSTNYMNSSCHIVVVFGQVAYICEHKRFHNNGLDSKYYRWQSLGDEWCRVCSATPIDGLSCFFCRRRERLWRLESKMLGQKSSRLRLELWVGNCHVLLKHCLFAQLQLQRGL